MNYSLVCLKYKNYYNREFRSLDTIDEFYDAVGTEYETQTNINNFNFSDGVMTSQVVDFDASDKDYAVLCDEDSEIVARFYILECKYSRYNQYTLTLLRDLLYDYKAEIENSVAFIEKGSVSADNPLIFNSEQMTFNQIKQSQIPIKDATGCPWIVAYLKKDYEGGEDVTVARNSNVPDAFTGWADRTILNFPLAYMTAGTPVRSGVYSIRTAQYNTTTRRYRTATRTAGGIWTVNGDIAQSYFSAGVWLDFEKMFEDDEAVKDKLFDEIKNNSFREADVNTAHELNGRTVKLGDKYYKFTYSEMFEGFEIEARTGTAFYNYMMQKAREQFSTASSAGYPVTATMRAYVGTVTLEELSIGNLKYNIPDKSTRTKTEDSAYDIICAPFGSFSVNNHSFNDPEAAMSVFQDLAGDTGNIEDVQILPYCPNAYSSVSVTLGNTEYRYIKEGDNVVGTIICVSKSSIKKTLPISWLNYPEFAPKTDKIEKKVQAMTDFARITNGSSIYEIGIAQNGGIGWIDISMTCLPITPYIKVSPRFGGLYGQTFEKDKRGLVLGGNFSIAYLSDPWKNFVNQNKNYSDIFDREVESIELRNKYALAGDVLGAATGAIGMAGKGATLGGGGIGAVAGAAAGAVAGLATGAADVAISEKLRNDSLDLKKDLFGFQLGNIQAAPKTTARSTSYNVDSMYFPVLEYYTATDEEKEAFRNKIIYDGMTIGVIGKPFDYFDNFVKAVIIRCPDIAGDYGIVNAISNELSKGVYKWE